VKCTEFPSARRQYHRGTSEFEGSGLRVSAADKTGHLPDKYRQGGMLNAKVTVLKTRPRSAKS
jgi:hypothetical protein